jgi:hypothetical protein
MICNVSLTRKRRMDECKGFNAESSQISDAQHTSRMTNTGWVNSAKHQETKQGSVELEAGGIYMKMRYLSSREKVDLEFETYDISC